MKILYLANIRLPTEKAHGLQIMKTCAALSHVAEVELVVPTRDNHLAGDPFAYYNIAERFKITTVNTPDFIRFGAAGFLVSALWFSEKARWLRAFWHVDIVYSRDAFVLVQYLLLGRKIVFEVHAKPSFISRIVARHAYCVVVISYGLKDAYAAAGVRAENIIIAPDAVDEHLFDNVPEHNAARDALSLPHDKNIVLYAGHLYARKGADTLAAAAAKLTDAHILFVGGTSADISSFKEKWESIENIEIVGHVAHEKIPLYLRAADVLVLPNSGRDEDSARFTSPMKLFEYMASGVPIIASDLPSLREIVNESMVYFFTPDDPHSLAEVITDLFAHYPEACAKALKTFDIAKEYSWDTRAQHILSFLHAV